MGLVLCLFGALAFGLLACVSKIAERRGCAASGLVESAFGWAAVLMLLGTGAFHTAFHMPAKAVTIAVVFGICAALAYFAFQTSIRTGKVTVAWLTMNLSTGVPAAVSIWAYKEKLTAIKLIAFALGLLSVLCLFWGQRVEVKQTVKVGAQKE